MPAATSVARGGAAFDGIIKFLDAGARARAGGGWRSHKNFFAKNEANGLQPLFKLFNLHLGIFQDFVQQSRPDYFAGMNWHHGSPSVWVLQEMMPATNPQNHKSGPAQGGDDFASAHRGKRGIKSDGDALDADEFRGGWLVFLDFQAKRDGFLDAFQQFVQRTRLRVAAGQRRHAGDIIAVLVPLDDDAELVLLGFAHEVQLAQKRCQCKAANGVRLARGGAAFDGRIKFLAAGAADAWLFLVALAETQAGFPSHLETMPCFPMENETTTSRSITSSTRYFSVTQRSKT